MEWNFKREEQQFETVPVGEHRVRIAEVEKAISNNGNDMLVLKLDVSGYTQQIWHYVVFFAEKPEITNRNLTQIFDSFGIQDGDFNLKNWVGKVGGCMTKLDDYGAKVKYFLKRDKVEKLPAWKDAGKERPKMQDLKEVKDEDLPF